MRPNGLSVQRASRKELRVLACRAVVCVRSYLELLYNPRHIRLDKLHDPLIQTRQMLSMTHRRAPLFISRMLWPGIEN